MLANPAAAVEIGSHTDNKGSDDYNKRLSDRRSDAVSKYIISKKISSDRIVTHAYGKTQPVAPNENPDGTDNPDGRAKNRRTEFKIISIDGKKK